MTFSRVFYGVPNGAIYPVCYRPGDVCPPELLAAARALGVLAEGPAQPVPSPEPKKSVRKAK